MPDLKPNLSRRHLPKRLAFLVGSWSIEVILADPSAAPLRGVASFRWLAADALLILRSRVPGGPPTSISVIGADDSMNAYSMLYTDERGVARMYEMTLTKRAWKLARNFKGFYQRFNGRIGADFHAIKGVWEKSPDGKYWEHDFQMNYTKRKSR
jgi:hypothetical protein